MGASKAGWVVRFNASLLLALLALCLIYRADFCYSLYTGVAIPWHYPKTVPMGCFWKYCRADLGAALSIVTVFSLASSALFWAARSRGLLSGCKKFLLALAVLSLAGVAALLRLHYLLLFEISSGLTVSLLVQSLWQMGVGDVCALIHASDLLFVASPLVVFFLVFVFVRRPAKIAGCCLLVAVGVLLPLQLYPKRKDVGWEITKNPAQFLFFDCIKTLKNGMQRPELDPMAAWINFPSREQMDSVQLVDPSFADARPRTAPPVFSAAPQGKWNILFCVLESTGAEYVFDPVCDGGTVPMPFLQRMSREGLALGCHRSTGNTSCKGAFGLFTGLYCRPDAIDFSMDERACIPTLNRFLNKGYASFLVCPMSSSFYFPMGLMKNNGVELFDRSAIPVRRISPGSLACHEADGVDFLLEKIDAAREPFFAVYWSGLAHWPYPDYGAATHVTHTGHPKRDSYYDNLRLLDAQLERIFEHLQKTGKLQNTLLLFIGDHGEAFGRHPGVLMHGFGVFDETYKTPAIFYQPALFPPGRIDWPTSHVDILPTVLDALNVRFPEKKVQGESVLRGKPCRKYLFTLSGAGDWLSAIDRDGRKCSLTLADLGSSAYDLARDPQETVRLPATPQEADVLVKFSNYQRQMVIRYNKSLRDHRPLVSP